MAKFKDFSRTFKAMYHTGFVKVKEGEIQGLSRPCIIQGSYKLRREKFKDFSRTFKAMYHTGFV